LCIRWCIDPYRCHGQFKYEIELIVMYGQSESEQSFDNSAPKNVATLNVPNNEFIKLNYSQYFRKKAEVVN